MKGKTLTPVLKPADLLYWRFYKNDQRNGTYFIVNQLTQTVQLINVTVMSLLQADLCPGSSNSLTMTRFTDGMWTITQEGNQKLFYIVSSARPFIRAVNQDFNSYTPSIIEKWFIVAVKSNYIF